MYHQFQRWNEKPLAAAVNLKVLYNGCSKRANFRQIGIQCRRAIYNLNILNVSKLSRRRGAGAGRRGRRGGRATSTASTTSITRGRCAWTFLIMPHDLAHGLAPGTKCTLHFNEIGDIKLCWDSNLRRTRIVSKFEGLVCTQRVCLLSASQRRSSGSSREVLRARARRRPRLISVTYSHPPSPHAPHPAPRRRSPHAATHRTQLR